MKVIDKTYTLPFTSDQVYAAWVSSRTVIAPATQMDIDPVAGGHYRLIMSTSGTTALNEGTFLVVEPGKRLVYSWEWNKDGEVSQIEVFFNPAGSGTDVRIVHSGFEKEESVTTHDAGWDAYIAGLTAFLTSKHA